MKTLFFALSSLAVFTADCFSAVTAQYAFILTSENSEANVCKTVLGVSNGYSLPSIEEIYQLVNAEYDLFSDSWIVREEGSSYVVERIYVSSGFDNSGINTSDYSDSTGGAIQAYQGSNLTWQYETGIVSFEGILTSQNETGTIPYIPEPSSICLFGLSLGLLGFNRKR